MPDREVITVRDLFYYQYAKIITRRAFNMPDGEAAKHEHYGFIKKTFRDLKSGISSMSDILREDWQLVESDNVCIYCGSLSNLGREHIVPRSLKIKPECPHCDTIQGIHNQVWSCKTCNSIKGTRGLYSFYAELYSNDKYFLDKLPTLLEKKYIKTMFKCHECAGTLDHSDPDGTGNIDVRDIDFIIRKYT
jgi:hypothetical protein